MIHDFLLKAIPILAGIFELIGVTIILIGGFRALVELIKRGFSFDNMDLNIDLAKAFSYSLQFKLGAEILETVIVQTIEQAIFLGIIVILRVGIGIILSKEIAASEEGA